MTWTLPKLRAIEGIWQDEYGNVFTLTSQQNRAIVTACNFLPEMREAMDRASVFLAPPRDGIDIGCARNAIEDLLSRLDAAMKEGESA